MPAENTHSDSLSAKSGTSRRLSTAFSGIFELRADTEPGAPGPMSAPLGCTGPGAYRAEIRRRFTGDRAVRQQMAVMSRRLRGTQHHGPVPATEPFAGEAREILASIRGRRVRADRSVFSGQRFRRA